MTTKLRGARLLREWMSANDKKQVDVAARTGLTQSAISRYLGGDRPPETKAAVAIEQLTGIPVRAWTEPERAPITAPEAA